METYAVAADGLRKRYGTRLAVDGIGFTVAPGECFGFLGANGAGKSTTMRMLYGRTRRTAGSLQVLGMDPDRAARTICAHLGVVPQGDTLDPELTALENLTVHAGYFGQVGRGPRRRAAELLDFVQLAPRAHDRVQDLSGGQQRRLMIARALVNQPQLLILDDPTTGLDPQARVLIWDRLAQLRRAGVTVIVTSHYMEEASQLCDRLVVMDQGRIVETGSPAAVVARHAGRLVMEVPWEGAAPPALSPPAAGVRRLVATRDRLLVFADDPEPVRRVLGPGLAARARIRPATLDDAFLHLTGRTLQED